MSALGQKRTSHRFSGMSASPQKRTWISTVVMSALCQKRTLAVLFDHLIGAGKHRRWHREAECFGSFEIDRQPELGRRLNWHLGWLLASQNSIDIAGRAPILVTKIGAIGGQAAGSNKRPFEIDRRKLVPRRQLDDQIAITLRCPTCRHNDTPVRSTRETLD